MGRILAANALASAAVSFGLTALTTASIGVGRRAVLAGQDLADDLGLHAVDVERPALAAGAGRHDVSADDLEARVLRGLVDLLGQLREHRVEARPVDDRGDPPVGRGRERDQRREALAGDRPAVLAPGDDHVGGHPVRGRLRRLGRGGGDGGWQRHDRHGHRDRRRRVERRELLVERRHQGRLVDGATRPSPGRRCRSRPGRPTRWRRRGPGRSSLARVSMAAVSLSRS